MNARITAALIGLLMLISTPAFSTTIVMMSDEALTLSSDAVIAGTVVDIRTGRAQHGINTYITIAVEESLKGYVGASEVTIREIGGTIGDDQQWIFGNPTYELGESVIAFLSQNRDGTLRTNQMALGKFSVERDETGEEVAARHMDESVLVVGEALLQSHDPDGRRPAAAFKSHLRDVVRRQPVPMFRSPLATAPLEMQSQVAEEVAGFKLFNNVRWFEPDDGQPVKYFIDRTGDAKIGATDSIAAIEAALKAWTDVPTASIVMQSAGLSDNSGSFCDGTSKIVFNDPQNQVTDPTSCGGVLAVGGYCAGGRQQGRQRRHLPPGSSRATSSSTTAGRTARSGTRPTSPRWRRTSSATPSASRTRPTRRRPCTRTRTSTAAAHRSRRTTPPG